MFYSDSLTYRNASDVNSAMARVYKNMFFAIVISMLTSYLIGTTPTLVEFFFTGFIKYVTIFLPIVAIFAISFALNYKPPKSIAQLMLLGFSVIMGLSFSAIFAAFQLTSIVNAFMSGAILFALMSFYGYFTKRSLESIGQFLFIGLIGIIIASIINLFIGSSVATMVISAIALIVFLGLTAVDTQRIREEISIDADTGRAEVIGALTLYINFINIFLSLVQLFGDNKE